jgi:4-carboxymuconolactone decarboxylase
LARLDPLTTEELTPEQKVTQTELLRTRKRVTGPFTVWLRNPPLADAANKVVLAVREHGKLEKRLYELIVLTVVRYWSAQYAWAAHEAAAGAAGLTSNVIEAIRARRKPKFSRPDESLVYEATTSLMEDKKLGDAAYQDLVRQFGLDRTIEIVTIAGLYSMVSTVLNGFEVPTPNGEKPFN